MFLQTTPLLLIIQLSLCFLLPLSFQSVWCQDIPNMARAQWLSSSAYRSAKCLDGSPALYYYRIGSPRSRGKWLIHQQGGGWCTSLEDCYQRSKTRLGSSSTAFWQPTMDFGTIPGCINARWCGGLIVNDPNKNPLTYDWNAVFIVNCDGGSQIGTNTTTTYYKDTTLYFTGSTILEAVITDLIKTFHLNEATEVIVGGDSAGGLSTYLHIDYWTQRLPNARITGVPDSGFFIENNDKHFTDNLRWVFQQMNGTSTVLNNCMAAYPSSPSECIFPQNMVKFINTHLFVLQSKYDEWQINNILGNMTEDAVNAFGDDLQAKLLDSISSHNDHGLFLDSCVHHCGGWGMNQDQDYSIEIDEDTAIKAFIKWYTTHEDRQKRMWIQDKRYPCKDCCEDDLTIP